jgi:membrane-bound serine protease (ClpP class)
MTTFQIVITGSLLACWLIAVLLIVAVSRHKKAATGALDLRGAVAFVEATLTPEGAVLVRGELWRARLRSGGSLERGRQVKVIGASKHLLEVEPNP